MKDYRFLNRREYFETLVTRIAKAASGERILLAAMDFDPDEPLIAKIMLSLCEAAKRGANVTLLVDAHNFLADKRSLPGPLFYQRNLVDTRREFANKLITLKALEASGGRFRITNLPARRFSAPIAGRSHIKAAVIGDEVYIGGCNLEKPQYLDVMVAWRNQYAADTLAHWLNRVAEVGNVREVFGDVDSEITLADGCSLVLDAGVPKQSLIYDEALTLIDRAQKRIFITCQYFPGGETAKHLAAAQARGVKVEIAYSHPRAQGLSAPLHHLHQLSQRARQLPRSLFAGRLDKCVPKLHAKVLVSEQMVLVGSHNYVPQGVNFGTAELALKSTNSKFGRELVACMKRQINQSSKTSGISKLT